jgi:L-aminopeptidase/D-esterase-like protein
VLAPDGGMVAGVDVRGGGPGTRETDLLAPTASVERVHAIVLTGGSAYGLAACDGVMAGLADRGIGLSVGPAPGVVVPLVPGAVLFDLGRGGSFRATPTAAFGAAALAAAEAGQVGDAAAMGCLGAGTGAVTRNLKGGIGTASLVLPSGVTVAVLVAVNAAGSPIDPETGELLGARLLLPADGPPPVAPGAAARSALRELTAPGVAGMQFQGPAAEAGGSADAQVIRNTTLAVVATDAALTKAQCAKMAAVAQNGMARALNPVHTMFDGDVVFGVSTGAVPLPDPFAFHEVTVAAADVLTRAIVRGLLAATGTTTPSGQWPSWSDVAFPTTGSP